MRKSNTRMATTKIIMVVIAAVLMAASLLHCSTAQTTHVLGDDLGWTIPPHGPITYSNWANNQTFKVGDELVFNFIPGVHDVVQVTKSNYESCNTNTPISAHTKSPATVPLNEEGERYFICSFRGHCLAGQKITINVVSIDDASSAAPTPSTYSPSSAAPSSSVTAALSMTFASTLIAMLC